MSDNGWIGVDLDGTLAHYTKWDGGKIGDPIPDMLERVVRWIENGHDVRIFTARATDPESVPAIEAWCEEHIGKKLPVTNIKDFHMIELWDDRCVQVVTNGGTFYGKPRSGLT